MPETPLSDLVKTELQAILAASATRAAEEQNLEEQLSQNFDNSELELRAQLQSIGEQARAEQSEAQEKYERARGEIVASCEREYNTVHAEYQSVLSDVENRYSEESQAAAKEKTDASWVVSSVLDDQSKDSPRFQFDAFSKRLMATKERLVEQRREMDAAVQATVDLMSKRRQWQNFDDPEPVSPPRSVEEAEEVFDTACQTIRRTQTELRKQKLPVLLSGVWPLLLLLLIGGAVGVPTLLFVDPAWLKTPSLNDRQTWTLVVVGVAAGIAFLALLTLFGISRSKSGHVFLEMQQALADLKTAHKRWLECAKKELPQRKKEFEQRYADIVLQRDKALANIEAKGARRLEETTARRDQERAEAEKKYPALLEEMTRARDEQLHALDAEHQQRLAELAGTATQGASIAKQQTAQSSSERRASEKRARAAISQKWLAATSHFFKAAAEFDEECRKGSDDWSLMRAADWSLPAEQVRQPIRIGSYDLDFERLDGGLPQDKQLWPPKTRLPVPFVLPFPERGSLLLESSGEGRAAAVEAIRSIMLRLLTSFPPGKIRFTVIDPVGLGQEFSAFMHLADYDELLIGTRIWTERAQIDKRLGDLSEHMENVFQAYLRNEFESIEEYNKQAGEVAEPYQFLVVANFPSNFSETAAQRLVSIATSGPRCGVYTLVSVDTKQPLPHSFDMADLEAAAMTYQWKGGRFVAADPDLAPFAMKIEPAPRAADFTEIVRTVGKQSKDSRRVEVPFDRITPRNGELWMLDSRKGLDVPLGRAGATKLQNLQLGRGTSQHVLVAGKTGSGKSSLLHTVITNLALHYSPDEVQFYLVDFKKGVEFKTYASHNLPHARIIGIESDREFGISVLDRLDKILAERGELFRKFGVQDIASYRKACPNEKLARMMLIIDEFQEFFVEDDSLSQNATLLLDRLVRQGRAFGIHVFLGSQSLGGAYSLARSTLGQVAVRIALQCSEGDAHLILSEENAAARLLTRPGEAIYNDSNGMVEGNHPFQIAWLPDERRDFYLEQLQDQVRARGIETEPAVVFEGNVASDPRRNPAIVQAIESFPPTGVAEGRSRGAAYVWLGEAVSIKPPTRIALNRRPGDNLLIIGQDNISVQGMLAVAFFTLAAQQKPLEGEGTPFAQVCVFDGDAVDADDATEWKRLLGFLPHRTVRAGQNEAAATIERIAAEVTRRTESNATSEPPMFVFILGLSRLRSLRNEEDDFGFGSMGDSKPASPGKLLTNVLREGPAVGVHSIVWCDTYGNLTRWMTTGTLKEFELRVALQMNANDSSSLMDSPTAARLGGNRALLYLRELGTIEKLRPYAIPSKDWLDWVADHFQNRAPAVASEP